MSFGLTTRIVEEILEKLNLYAEYSEWWDSLTEDEQNEIFRELEDTIEPHIEDELRWMGSEDLETDEEEY